MYSPHLQIQQESNTKTVEATLNQNPSSLNISELEQPLSELAQKYENVHLIIQLKEALTTALIEPIMSLRDLAKDKITVTLDFRYA